MLAAAVAALTIAQAAAPVAPERTPVLDNATVTVTRLRFAPGTGESVHTHAFPLLIVQLTPGMVDLTVDDMRARGPRETGLVTFMPANVPHAAVNAGSTTFDLMAIAVKPARPPAPAAPPTDAPPGITRTTLLDNADVRVVRVQFDPGGGEPVHTHLNDLVTVQLSGGQLEILNGGERTKGLRDPGFVQFLQRGVEHSFGNGDRHSFELLSVSIK